MTPEASLTKLSYLLSRSDLSLPEKRKLMEENLRGEKTVIDEQTDPQSLLLDMSLLKSLTKLLTSNTVTPSPPPSLSTYSVTIKVVTPYHPSLPIGCKVVERVTVPFIVVQSCI